MLARYRSRRAMWASRLNTLRPYSVFMGLGSNDPPTALHLGFVPGPLGSCGCKRCNELMPLELWMMQVSWLLGR
jgi:hypothetical protein